MSAYQKVTEYYFEANDELISITFFSEHTIELEEVRKNGQEDTHMKGTLYKNKDSGLWEWENGTGNTMFSEYHGQDLEDSILDYIQKNGLPQE